jgi:hypothetical protein
MQILMERMKTLFQVEIAWIWWAENSIYNPQDKIENTRNNNYKYRHLVECNVEYVGCRFGRDFVKYRANEEL